MVGVGLNEKFSIFAAAEPSPAAAEDTHGALGHLFLPLFIAAKSIIDLLGQFALWFLAGVGESLPKVGVIGVTPSIVANGGADLGRNGIEVCQKFLERFFLKVGIGGEGFVEIVDVSSVMFVVMEGHCFGIDIRLEGVGGVGQRGQSEGPGYGRCGQAWLSFKGFGLGDRGQESRSEGGAEKKFEEVTAGEVGHLGMMVG